MQIKNLALYQQSLTLFPHSPSKTLMNEFSKQSTRYKDSGHCMYALMTAIILQQFLFPVCGLLFPLTHCMPVVWT